MFAGREKNVIEHYVVIHVLVVCLVCIFGTSVYRAYLGGSLTLTKVTERLAVEVTLPIISIQVCSDQLGLNPDLPVANTLSTAPWQRPILVVIKTLVFVKNRAR